MPKKRKLLWRIYPSYLLIILISLFAVGWYFSYLIKEFYLEETVSNLKARAFLIGGLLKGYTFKEMKESESILDELCKELGSNISTRITIILPSGVVIGDSEEDSTQMENHADRPEIIRALTGDVGLSIRYSPTMQREMIYVAIPIIREGKICAVVRTSITISALGKTLESIYLQIALSGLIIAILVALVSLIISYYINKPLYEMKKGAERFARGDLTYRLFIPDYEEIASLADAMNKMAVQLNDRISLITLQKNELEAILSSMVEALLVIDMKGYIVKVNQAASYLFRIDTAEVLNRSVQEVIRNTDLLNFITKTLQSTEPVEDDIIFTSGSERFLQAYGTQLPDGKGKYMGALIVLYDVTPLKKLETVRRDFVANVSHELKTPITSIKGFIETLKDGAINDSKNAMRFLDIVDKHVERLNNIIDDLLSLSRIEQEAEGDRLNLSRENLKRIIESAIFVCNSKANKKEIKIDLVCNENLFAKINPALFEEALVNLIDNAIKYSNPKSAVFIKVKETGTNIDISIRDEGCGIPKEDLIRIFERFYRVDKARSRDLGGTGLGLAIAKHIVNAHHGQISVKSSLQKGSTFCISLPLN